MDIIQDLSMEEIDQIHGGVLLAVIRIVAVEAIAWLGKQ